MPRIKVIELEESVGRLREIYEGIISSRKQLAEVHKIQSLRPESIVKHMELYMEIMFSKSDMTRAEREMAAVIVSLANDCQYCAIHHGEALNHYWKDEQKLESFKRSFDAVLLTEREQAICEFARNLTLKPGSHLQDDQTLLLKKSGLSDAAILDLVLVISYFNFVNRIVLSLDVEIELSAGKGYNY